jgi:uncharacterized protein YkwD
VLVAFALLVNAACGPLPKTVEVPRVERSGIAGLESREAARIAELTNEARRNAGLPPFRVDDRLMQAAQLQANQMAASGLHGHEIEGATYPSPRDRLAAVGYEWELHAENTAWEYREPAEAVNRWMRSPGHRANILSKEHQELGSGFAVDSRGRRYYVQVFARPAK